MTYLFLLVSVFTMSQIAMAALNNPFILDTTVIPKKFQDFDKVSDKSFSCVDLPVLVPPNNLDFNSKYLQSDKTKSTLNPNLDSNTIKNRERIDEYFETISELSDIAVYGASQSERLTATNCIINLLSQWADANAMLNERATFNGKAARKFLLAVVSSNLLKMKATYTDFRLDKKHQAWLNKLAIEVQKDYIYRLYIKKKNINNHDYWAAWAVATTAVLLNKPSYLNYAREVLAFAIKQLENDGNYSYFPNELSRGKLASYYSNFALVPLIYLTNLLMKNNNASVSSFEALKPLALFAFDSAFNTSSIKHLITDEQTLPEAHHFAWFYGYVYLIGDNPDSLSGRIQLRDDFLVDAIRVGGNLNAFYPVDRIEKQPFETPKDEITESVDADETETTVEPAKELEKLEELAESDEKVELTTDETESDSE